MRRSLRLVLAGSLALVGCNGSLCDASALTTALAGAHAGDTVVVGSCTIAGAFSVPAGVTIAGGTGSVLESIDGGAPVLATQSGSVVRGLALHVMHGGVGVRASGNGVSAIDLDVSVERGIGIGLDGAALSASHVRVHGPVTAANVLAVGADPSTTGTFGIVGRALGDGMVVLDDVAVSGFSIAGVSLTDGALTWVGRSDGPDVSATRGIGIALFGTQVSFSSVEVSGMLAGPGLPGVGVAVAPHDANVGDADLGDVSIHDGEGYGLFSDGAQVQITGAHFEHMGLTGIRLQGGTFSASDLTCTGNGGAGLLAVNVETLTVAGGDLVGTIELGLVTPTGTIPSGDEVQVVRDLGGSAPPLDLSLVDVRLDDNGRAGLLIDAAGGMIGRLVLTRVAASATGAELGAVAQNTSLPMGWDADVTRTGAALTNDPAFHTSVPVQGIMMPPGLVATAPAF